MIKALYVHIPFCDQICLYCDFCKLVANQKLKQEYTEALIKELEAHAKQFIHLETIYIGGGTPSSLDFGLLEDVLQTIDDLVDMAQIQEFTFEANPNDIDEELLEILFRHHITRISLGVQTISDESLDILGRMHKRADIDRSVQLIENDKRFTYNLDFIYALPNQTLSGLNEDLNYIGKLMPPHVSYYGLILEEHTQLHHLVSKKAIQLPDDDLSADFSLIVRDTLRSLGYERYETSNYALKHQASKHNLAYWNLEEYIGIGLGAASQFSGKRFTHTRKISEYIKAINQDDFGMIEEEFNPKMETLLLGLRKMEGVNMDAFEMTFKESIFIAYPGLNKHLENGLLEITGNHLHFTDKGAELANQVYMEIIEEPSC